MFTTEPAWMSGRIDWFLSKSFFSHSEHSPSHVLSHVTERDEIYSHLHLFSPTSLAWYSPSFLSIYSVFLSFKLSGESIFGFGIGVGLWPKSRFSLFRFTNPHYNGLCSWMPHYPLFFVLDSTPCDPAQAQMTGEAEERCVMVSKGYRN